jgi:hypothetical protein
MAANGEVRERSGGLAMLVWAVHLGWTIIISIADLDQRMVGRPLYSAPNEGDGGAVLTRCRAIVARIVFRNLRGFIAH